MRRTVSAHSPFGLCALHARRERGTTIEDVDAIISATALRHGAALVTTNARHFPMTELVVWRVDPDGNRVPHEPV